ncbi:hypothetical protein C7S15_6270 [Burkholderia cepacia]|nr:hypothetical protein [Burkholderia cepacia]
MLPDALQPVTVDHVPEPSVGYELVSPIDIRPAVVVPLPDVQLDTVNCPNPLTVPGI